MTPAIYEWVKEKVKEGVLPKIGKILEVGAQNINGSVRDLFDQNDYVGIDLNHGPGVDLVLDIHGLQSVILSKPDLIICLEMLEHDSNPIHAVTQMREILKENGFLLISTPTTGFPEHKFPKDYWRFMEDTYQDIFFKNMDILFLDKVYCPAGYPGLIGLAKNTKVTR